MAKKSTSASKPAVKKPRKQYLVGVKKGGGFNYDKQPAEVRDYVRRYKDDSKSGKMGLMNYGDVHREAIAKDKAARSKKALKNPYIDPSGHTMTAAKNRLKKGWKVSQKGKGIKKAAKFYSKQGMASKAAKKRARDNHAVKFGVDPYHK